jgi:hypothetical protein
VSADGMLGTVCLRLNLTDDAAAGDDPRACGKENRYAPVHYPESKL